MSKESVWGRSEDRVLAGYGLRCEDLGLGSGFGLEIFAVTLVAGKVCNCKAGCLQLKAFLL